MAELSLFANLVAVVGAGLQLSVGLYDFASTLGSAGGEIQDMGYDITLICTVLRRVQSTLDNPKSTRLSVTALQTTQEIVRRCQNILDDIKGILNKLRKDGQTQLDILARVKWTWKRPKILMLRGSLQSCTTTLHLMLSAIDWARNATRRSLNGEHDQDRDQDREMTHSLFLAQQSANHRLEELEDQVMGEPASEDDYGDPLNPSSPLPVSPISADAANRRQRNGSIIIDGINNSKSPTSTPLQAKRTSVLLNECLFDGEKSAESTRRRTLWPLDRRQSLFQTDKLLKRLIEQTETPTSGEQDHPQQSNEDQVLSESIRESYSTQETWPVLGTNIEIHEHDVGFQANTVPAAEEAMFRESSSPPIINDQNFNKPITKTLPFSSIPNDEVTTPLRGNIDPTCQELLSSYVQKYSTTLSSRGYPLDWRQYALYIVLGEHERPIGLEEKPLRLYKNLEKEGKNPSYVLRHMASSGMSYTVQTTGLRNTNLASEQLDYCCDVFLGVLGWFLGLHKQFRSSSELLLTTQQSVKSCRELLKVVEVVLDHDLRRSDTLLEAKDAMFDKITELVHAAREAFSPVTADDDSVFLPDEGKSLVNAATACVRGAGECVAKTRMVLEQIGDFELESAEVRSPTVAPIQ